MGAGLALFQFLQIAGGCNATNDAVGAVAERGLIDDGIVERRRQFWRLRLAPGFGENVVNIDGFVEEEGDDIPTSMAHDSGLELVEAD